MTQLVPATCVLGPGMTGLTIGLRVLNLDGTTYAAFATTGVAETSTAGTYRKAGGVVAPLAGGYIVWGTALVDLAEATVESASANVTYQAGVAVAAADANGNVPVDVKKWQGELPEPLESGYLSVLDVYGSLAAPAQQSVRDAMKLAPTAGAPAAGSVDKHLDDLGTAVGTLALEATVQEILLDTGTTLPGLIEAGGGSLDLDTALEGVTTLGEALRVMLAALAGVSSGGGSATVRFKSLDGESDRIVATVDGQGNRTAVVLDGAE